MAKLAADKEPIQSYSSDPVEEMAEIADSPSYRVESELTHPWGDRFATIDLVFPTRKLTALFHANFNACNVQVDSSGCVQVSELNGSM